MSDESRIEAITGALDEARFAHRVARSGSGSVVVVGADEVASHVLLLACVPDDVRRTYAQRVLGSVLDHDRRTQGELIGTLAEWLACSASRARTAESLHLHVNTVRYRIEKVQGADRPRPVQLRGPGRRLLGPALAWVIAQPRRRPHAPTSEIHRVTPRPARGML
ncbi:PucR family transcriptional regulator [Nocardioides sp. B-3]|uniref:PucR family transcriptional regulator n=1 Tax=Nocardioides sp. B-3 TaxID=2895565 RepID=UPI0021521660|nr:helix-turn-helix domain-containing protein [Nocardioides sp. B-3]UUZ59841.1 helix-turn-helix domain-containing protein [Nocardioides sp. B-3]